MIPHAVQSGDILPYQLQMYQKVVDLVDGMEYPADCHDVCSRVAGALGPALVHVRGRFNGGWDHSWLVFAEDPEVIIDAYPWAQGGGPVILTTKWMSPWRSLYCAVTPAICPVCHGVGGAG